MPRYVRCSRCNGRGGEPIIGEETCPGCAGLGRDKTSDLLSEPCRTCNGRGRVTYCRNDTRPCRVCNGQGVIQY